MANIHLSAILPIESGFGGLCISKPLRQLADQQEMHKKTSVSGGWCLFTFLPLLQRQTNPRREVKVKIKFPTSVCYIHTYTERLPELFQFVNNCIKSLFVI